MPQFRVLSVLGALMALCWPASAVAAESSPGNPAGTVASAGNGSVSCTITDPRITESSGLVAAGGQLFTVNDGGSQLAVYVLDRSCRVVRVIRGAIDPFDVEDLARTADGTLWLADIGDNLRQRSTVAIELLSSSGPAAARLYRFRYPDGAHDAEALLVDHAGTPFIVTKEALGVSSVYIPQTAPSTASVTPLRKVATVRMGLTGVPGGPAGPVGQLMVTGGAVSAAGDRLALRTYTDAYVWSAPDGDLLRALRSGQPTRIPLPPTRQGEAIAFSPDGKTLLTSTEGLPAPVHAVPLAAAEAAAAAAAEQASSAAARTTGPGSSTPAADASGAPAVPSTSWQTLGALTIAGGLATILVWGAGRLRRTVYRG
jgi:sugar lactone lactonase YvrE